MRRLLLLGIAALPCVAAPPRVVVDLSKAMGPPARRAVGFLHGFTPDGKLPLDASVEQLGVRLHRTRPSATWTQAARMKALGITQQVVISDSWGYRKPWPGDHGDWEKWEKHCADLVRKAAKLGLSPQWDLWNEADHPYFWGRDTRRFREAWRRGVKAIRAVDPQAVIVGPSLQYVRPGKQRFAEFLAFAKQHDVVPDQLSWHFPVAPIAEVAKARELLKELGIADKVKGLQINEYGKKNELTPGKIAWYVTRLERSGIDAALHAVWGDEGKGNLDGLLADPAKNVPRGRWWVYQRYAAMRGTLLAVTDGGDVSALASRDEARIFVLLGHAGEPAAKAGTIELVIHGVPAASTRATVVVERYAHKDNAALPKPEVLGTYAVQPADGRLRIRIPWGISDDAYGVRIELR